MDRLTFLKEFKRLCDYYSKKYYETDSDLTMLYYNTVKNKSSDQFKQQVNEIIATSKFMPKVAEFDKRQSNFIQREYDDLEMYYDVGGNK